jgi:hypothetical protein
MLRKFRFLLQRTGGAISDNDLLGRGGDDRGDAPLAHQDEAKLGLSNGEELKRAAARWAMGAR